MTKVRPKPRTVLHGVFVDKRRLEPVDPRWLTVRTIRGLKHHDVIYAVVAGLDGRVYLGVSNEKTPGVHAQLWSYDPRDKRFRRHLDVARFAHEPPESRCIPHCKFHLCLEVDSDGIVYGMTHCTVPARGEEYWLAIEAWADSAHGYEGTRIFSYDPAGDRAESLGVLARHEGARVMTIDRQRHILYTLCYPRSHLYRYDIKERRIRDLGRISQQNSFGMACDRHGRLFVTDDRGTLLRYDPDTDRLEALGLRLPDAPWREGCGNYARRLTVAPDGTFWGITAKSVRLFHYDPYDGADGRLEDHGVLVGRDRHDEWPILPPGKAIVAGPDGWCYAALGGGGNYCDPSHVPAIVRYGPSERRTEMLGLAQGQNLPPPWTAQDSAVGPDGRIYSGVQTLEGPPQLLILTPPPHPLPKRRSKSSERTTRLCEAYGRRLRAAKMGGFASEHSPFVTRGHVTMRHLGWRTNGGKLIPRGECRITGLTVGPSGTLYGVTSGRRSHLFVYHPHRANWLTESSRAHPSDLGVLPCDRTRALTFASDGRLYIGAGDRLMVYDPDSAKGLASPGLLGLQYRHPYPHELLDLRPARPRRLNGFIEALVPIEGGRLLVGLTSNDFGLFVFDPEKERIVQRVQLPQSRACRALLAVRERVIGSAGPDAEFFSFHATTGRLKWTGRCVPAEPGRECLNYADSLAVGPNGLVYGGTADGFLFEMDPQTLSVRTIGRATALPRLRAMTVFHDGRVFAVAGPPDSIVRLVCYDPNRASLEVLGVLQVRAVPEFWAGYDFECMTAAPDGVIFLGESDDISHLFLYFPEAVVR